MSNISFDIIARDRASKTFDSVAGASDKAHSSLGKFGKAAAVGAAAVGALGVAATAFVVKAGAGYVASLNKIQALGDLTDKQTNKVAASLEAQSGAFAKMGMTTGDAASGMVELVKAGQSVDDALKSVVGTMTLAKAGELSVADASSLVANTLNTFHLSAKRAGDVANYLANAANISSADVSDLAESFKYVAPVAAASGVSLKQTNAILAELSNSGIAASNAGTGFRKFLLSLKSPAGAAAKDLHALGVEIYDSSGKMKPLGVIIDDLDTKMSKLTDKQRSKDLKDIFGLQGISTAQVILDNGVAGLDRYTKGVGKAGAAQKLAESASKGLGGTINMLKADFVSMAQSTYRVLSPLADKAIRPIAIALGHVADKAGPAMTGFVSKIEGALGKIDLSGFKAKMAAGFDNLQLPDLGAKLKEQAQAWAVPTIDGFKTGLNSGDWSGLGKAVGNGLVSAINGAGKVAGKVFDGLDKLFAKVDWVGLGISIGKQAPSLVIGLAAGILNFDPVALFKGVMKHWGDILIALLAVAFTPGRIVGKVGELLARVPLAGKFLEWALLGTKKLGDGLVSGIWKATKFAGDALLEGFRRIFPGAGVKFGEWLALFPIRLQLWALKLEERGLKALLGLGKGIARGSRAVLAKISETVARMLKPFADAGGWLISKGSAIMGGLLRGISSMLHPVLNWYRALPMRILAALGHVGSILVDSGKSIIGGLLRGLRAKAGELLHYVSGLASKVKDAFKNVLKIHSPSRVFHGYGVNILEGLIQGMGSQQPKLKAVMDKLAKYIDKQGQKLSDLMSKKRDVISSFKGMTSSVFGATFTDADGNDTQGSVDDLLKFQRQQLARARQLQADVKTLIGRGLSKSLINQMISAGDSGVANLHALAGGTKGDVTTLNALDKATSAALGSAGNLAGNALYGHDIAVTKYQEGVAKAIRRELEAWRKQEDDNTYIVVQIDSENVIKAIKKRNARKGVKSAGM